WASMWSAKADRDPRAHPPKGLRPKAQGLGGLGNSGRTTRSFVCTTGRTMARHGKKFTAAAAQVEDRPYTFEEAMPLLQKAKFAKFDETVEVAMRLGVDPKHADQMVRGTVVLPHGLGKSKRVLVIAG